ncbi:MmpS family protein [[Mycobacterium] wendilense]|uniref:MmpS family protein n=1 Tax=[Mycobacterium] wendilense TaxID=3064284 RepID=A0ABN9NY24_9MYCO|nr:MmpS family protein [Mycolicibacterium sp. MU0050]CAJ1579359.1 MmpS family protein [Mycolicibacterium sp. MU0050]
MWIPLLILAVVGAGGYTVSRLHGIFGSEDHNTYAGTQTEDRPSYDPKHLSYEVFGPPGTVANISYFDVDSEPQYVRGASLPWSMTFALTEASAMANIIAQGDAGTIGCRITVDDEVKEERVAQGVSAFTYCLLRAA